MLKSSFSRLFVVCSRKHFAAFSRSLHRSDGIRSGSDGPLKKNLGRRKEPVTVIDGKAIARGIWEEVKEEVQKFVSAGKRPPHLSVLLVGKDPGSQSYVKNKMRACQYTGINSETIPLPDTISQEELLEHIDKLNKSDDVDGIIVQLPVPPQISERQVCDAVLPSKDVDGFNVVNVGRFYADQNTFVPATPAAVLEILRRTGVETFGKNAMVAGRSKNVGLPIAVYLQADGRYDTKAGDATTTICHRFTPPEELEMYARTADIIVAAAGVPGLIRGDMVKPGAVVIDVGINRIIDEKTGKTKLVGDVDFEAVSEVAGYVTPVPGGVGPVTVAMLLKNTLKAYKKEISNL